MRVRLTAAILAIVAAACGDAAVPLDIVSEAVDGDLGTTCRGLTEALIERDGEGLLITLEEIRTLAPEAGSGQPALAADISAGLKQAGGDALADATLRDVSGDLVALSNELFALGAEDCATIAEVAAELVERAPVNSAAIIEALAENRASWDAAGITTYWMRLLFTEEDTRAEFVCGLGGEVVVQVLDGDVTTAVDSVGGCIVSAEAGIPLTVRQLFDLIEDNLEAEELDIFYHPTLGYPEQIFAHQDGSFLEASVVTFREGVLRTDGADALLATLETQREIWQQSGISSYRMTVEIGCFCPEEFRGPFEVTVVDGAIEAVVRAGEEATEPFIDQSLLTVEGLFETIEGYALADRISIEYAPEGYPGLIDVDPSSLTNDEELVVTVHDLQPVD